MCRRRAYLITRMGGVHVVSLPTTLGGVPFVPSWIKHSVQRLQAGYACLSDPGTTYRFDHEQSDIGLIYFEEQP